MTTTPAAPKILTVVPARYASTRFHGKIIAPVEGKPLVVHTYEQVLRASLVSEAIIATDDEKVVEAVKPFGVNVVMTRNDHESGTDRIAEVAQTMDADIVANVQGDEPVVSPETIDATIQALIDDETAVMATARHRITDPEAIQNPNVVKVVCDGRGRALYFSRAAIPVIRDEADRSAAQACYWQHVGLYTYRRDFLLAYAKMPQTPLEKLEKLEQLRVLENGYTIAVVDTDSPAIGVDTPEDLERVRALFASSRKEAG